jgi:N-dimethylarginine dimethylaminohydrolase
MNGERVLLMTLSERTSAKGIEYLSGWLGRARVVAF